MHAINEMDFFTNPPGNTEYVCYRSYKLIVVEHRGEVVLQSKIQSPLLFLKWDFVQVRKDQVHILYAKSSAHATTFLFSCCLTNYTHMARLLRLAVVTLWIPISPQQLCSGIKVCVYYKNHTGPFITRTNLIKNGGKNGSGLCET